MKNRFTVLYFLAAVTAGIIVACSGESAEKTTTDVVVEPGEDTTARESGFFERSQKNPVDNALVHAFELAKRNGKHVTYFTNTYSGSFFLLQNRKEMYIKEGKVHPSLRFGLIDGKGKLLLPATYERIGNPGMIADDFMEIRANGKYGLYNYAENKIIQPEYDALYPSSIMEYVAIGQKGNAFFKVYANGSNKAFAEGKGAPDYVRLLKTYRYNTESEQFGLWTETYAIEVFQNEEEYMYGGNMIIPPSYLLRLGIFPDFETNITPRWSDMGMDSIDVSLIDNKKTGNGITASLLSAYAYVSDARGYESQQRYVITTDRNNSVKAKKKLLEFDNYTMMNTCEYPAVHPIVHFINDSLVEVRSYMENTSEALPYRSFSRYTYYQISSDGSINELKANGLFPMTAAIELKRAYFKGCFIRLLEEEEAMNADVYDEDYAESGMSMLAFTDHLSADDLEYMRNEIYARHGMKFKDPEWDALFRTFKWYKPKFNSVDSKLTPVEKKNLELIRIVEKELRAHPESLVHESHAYEIIAG